jgi:RimJ/RimL family protein N-acetyltransferase
MVEIQKGLLSVHKKPAATLFLSAFSEKLAPILGDDSAVLNLVQSRLVIQSCFSAVEGERLLGVLALQAQEQNFINPNFKNLWEQYGFFPALYKGVVLSFMKHNTQVGELYIEGIAVVESAQGKGVGSKLFEALDVFAKEERFSTITLEVIDTNSRAITLYERLGFCVVNRSKVWPLNWLLGWGFRETILMEKEIEE